MRLGERCDEIVRLIDETLADLGIGAEDSATPGSTVTALPAPAPSERGRTPRPRVVAERPDQAAAGF